jgi:hypothetical protein
MIETAAVVTRTEGLMSAAVDDELVVLSLRSDSYLAIDRIGRRIWELLESPRRFDDLVVLLADEFTADPTVVAADVSAFLDELEAEGLVNGSLPRAAR